MIGNLEGRSLNGGQQLIILEWGFDNNAMKAFLGSGDFGNEQMQSF